MTFSFSDWYRRNGERLNAKRKARYHTDDAYREKVLETNQSVRQKRKESLTPEEQAAKRAARARKGEGHWKVVEGVVGGKKAKLYTIGMLAKALGCSAQSIRIWEKQGVIPTTPLRSQAGTLGDRLYTEEMVLKIRSLLKSKKRLSFHAGIAKEPQPRETIRVVSYSGKKPVPLTLYTISALAKAISRSASTLEQMELRGTLPETPFKTTSIGRRLYSAEMIQVVKELFEMRDGNLRSAAVSRVFREEVLKRWTKLGVFNAELLDEKVIKK